MPRPLPYLPYQQHYHHHHRPRRRRRRCRSFLSLKRLLLKLQLSWEHNGQSLMRIGHS